MKQELKGCPFCGSKDIYQQNSDYGFAIECRCGATGPTACEDDDEGDLKARQAWNSRIHI